MKVILVSTITPFVDGGSTLIVDSLAAEIRRQGHTVEVLCFPFDPTYSEVLDQMLAMRLIDLTQHGDRLIAIRMPSHLIRHRKKILWFIHHYRSAYDLWGTSYQEIPATAEGLGYRAAIIQADNAAFAEASRIFANSRVVAGRLKKFNGVEAEVLYPPLPDAERYRTGRLDDYVLYLSRLTHHKRQWLALEAMRFTRTGVRLVIAGAVDPGAEGYVEDLNRRVRDYGLADRVTVTARWVSAAEKIDLFADCLAAAYFPLDEDSYGYPTLEAHHAGKAVLTTSDAGGTGELVIDGVNGFLTAPDPEAIAAAMDRLYSERERTARMGAAGGERIRRLGITWENAMSRLLA